MADRRRKTRSAGRAGLPGRSDVVALWRNGIDIIGLSVSDAEFVDTNLWPIFYIVVDDVPVSLRPTEEAFNLAAESQYLNMGPMIGKREWGVVLYRVGTPEATLLRACKVAKVVYGDQFYDFDITGKSVFGTPDIGAYTYP